jgi:hypothetical protein
VNEAGLQPAKPFAIIDLVTVRRGAPAERQVRHFGCLASLFSPTLIRRLTTPSALSEIQDVLAATGLDEACRALPLQRAFEHAYAALLDSYRCEYLYKNAIASKILLGKHSLRTAGMLSELQVQDCKLDLLLVNGQTVAYEIKTELDSPDRLFNQLSTYQRAFECVYVVTHESCAARFTSDLPLGVGILQLSSRYTLNQVRQAETDYSRLDPGVMFNILRRDEYVPIIRKHFGAIPMVPNTLIYTECRRLFLELPLPTICTEMSAALHERAHRALAVSQQDAETAPHSLTLHVLSGNIDRKRYEALSSVVL